MKFPNAPLRPLIHEVLSDLKRIAATVSFTEEDCYIWAVDAVRQISSNVYDKSYAYITINRHSGMLPKDFYKLETLRLCESNVPNPTSIAKGMPSDSIPHQLLNCRILAPADIDTIRHTSRSCVAQRCDHNYTYTIKLPPGIIRCGLYSALLFAEYLCLPVDAAGDIMCPDEINAQLAVKNYIKTNLLQEMYILREISEGVYLNFQRQWEDYLGIAQQAQKMPDMAQTEYMAIAQDARYRHFNYKNQ